MDDVDSLSELEMLEQGLTGWDRQKALAPRRSTVFDRGRVAEALFDPLDALLNRRKGES